MENRKLKMAMALGAQNNQGEIISVGSSPFSVEWLGSGGRGVEKKLALIPTLSFRRERPEPCPRVAPLNRVGMVRRAVRVRPRPDAIGTFRPADAGRGHRGVMSVAESGSWKGKTSKFWTRVKTMNLRFELEGIALSMPTLKRGRRLGSCTGTDEAVPSPGSSWVGLERRALLGVSRIGLDAEQCSALRAGGRATTGNVPLAPRRRILLFSRQEAGSRLRFTERECCSASTEGSDTTRSGCLVKNVR